MEKTQRPHTSYSGQKLRQQMMPDADTRSKSSLHQVEQKTLNLAQHAQHGSLVTGLGAPYANHNEYSNQKKMLQ